MRKRSAKLSLTPPALNIGALGIALSALAVSSLGTGCGDKDDDTGTDTDGGTTDTDGGSDSGEPDGVDCNQEGDVCVLSGTIVSDYTLTADVAWLLRGGVFIGDDVSETVLSIEPGTTIYGESSTDGMLVIRRNSKLMAEGTVDAPIVFTSSKAAGSRARGDWGGLIINGNAPINACPDPEAELCEAYGEGGTGWYGGNDPTDDSGVLHYVRVEFAGTLISPDNELNGIAFQGVGSSTTIDYVQVHMNADDGVEFFGGTAQAKHIVTTGIGDDNIDWTDGWQGMLQYAVVAQFDDNGDNGIEADNNGEDNEAEPYSAPKLANITLVGSPDSSDSDVGLLLREGTQGHIMNALVVGFNEACLDVDNEVTVNNGDAGDLTLSHSTLDCATNFKDDDELAWTQSWFEGQDGNGTGGVTLSGWAPTSEISGGDPSAWDSFFDATGYQGAIGDTDWTAGWTTTEAN